MKAIKNLLYTAGLILAGLLCVNWQGTSANTLETPPTPNSVPEYALAGETSLVEAAGLFKKDDFCWKETYGRGVGTIPKICPNGMENDAGLCYTLCKEGYYGVGPVCWKSCPEGFRDDGAFCFKPESYGRGGGYIWKIGDRPFSASGQFKRCEEAHGKGNCEIYGAIVYPKCKEGFYAAGCCVCSPVCPEGFTDIGVSCAKPSYGRGVGIIPTICEDGKENNAGLCYKLCRDGFKGVGPVCWEVTCPYVNGTEWTDCGAGCAQSTNTCATAIIDMTVSPLVAVLSIAGMTVSGGGSGVVKAVASTGKTLKYTAKATKGVSKITQAAIERDLMAKAREQLNGQPMPEHQKKGIEEYAAMAYDAARTYDFDWRDFAGVDPTGLTSVAAAYANPLCKDIKSTPSYISNVKEVKFHSQGSLTPDQVRSMARQNEWTIATAAEVHDAWTYKGLDVYAFGMMADGSFAVPVQKDHSNFKKGPNIGAVGGNQGFFYIDNMVNIALNKPAIQSSQYGTKAKNGAQLANDGIVQDQGQGGFLQHTNNDTNPWWEVDLQGHYEIASIRLYNRTNCCPERLNDFTILVSDTPFTGNAGGTTFIAKQSAPKVIESYSGKARGRYVRFFTDQTNYMSIPEIEIFGTPVEGN
ncbi:discoidin domain-containing protein [Phaeodactylibacter xiamenensis]|uniref:galactose-binding domain-containing protein n=1 Tax=Phaeodactylibacter xiamenensis TaxID=1524460 RepID=UPI003CCB9A1E